MIKSLYYPCRMVRVPLRRPLLGQSFDVFTTQILNIQALMYALLMRFQNSLVTLMRNLITELHSELQHRSQASHLFPLQNRPAGHAAGLTELQLQAIHNVQPGVDDHIDTAALRAWNGNASWAVFVTQPGNASVLSRWVPPQLSYLVNVWKGEQLVVA